MGRGGGGGGGGRIRFRASSSGHAFDPHDELGRRLRNGTSKFGGINAGCFFKSDGMYCPERLTDYYCVMWTQGLQQEDDEGTLEVLQQRNIFNNGTTLPPLMRTTEDPQLDTMICAGDFTDASIVQVNCILPLIILLIGTGLNLLTARVAVSYCDRQLPVCFYLVVLSMVDTVLLYYRQLDLWLQSVFDIKLTLSLLLMDESACQLMNMLYSSLHHFKSMLQIAMAVDARRLVVRPLQSVERYTNDWVKNSLILMCVILVLVNGHHLWTLALVKESSVGEFDRVYHCGWGVAWPVTELFTTWLWPLTDLLLGELLPMLVALWAASSAYRQLWRVSGRSDAGDKSLDYHIIDRRLYRSVSHCLLACSLAYAALQSPSAVHSFIMYARFLAASLAAQASGARELGQFYQPEVEEWRLFVGRLCSSVQPMANSLLLLVCVPHYRRDAVRLLKPTSWRRLRPRDVEEMEEAGPSDAAKTVSKFAASAQVLSINRKQQNQMSAV